MRDEWPEKIERPYGLWLTYKKPSHPIDFEHFIEFMWECFRDPNNAPGERDFSERLARDLKHPRDEHGYPHPVVEKYQSLYATFPYIARFILAAVGKQREHR